MVSSLLIVLATVALLKPEEVMCLGVLTGAATPLLASGTTLGFTASTSTALAAAAIPTTALIAGTAAVVGALAGSGAFARKNQRVRRDASCFGITNPELMFVLAANSDQLGCGQRLVCELEATNDEELSETERLILQLFGRDVRPLKASQIGHPRAAYHYAAQVGMRASSAAECAEVFDLCPMNRTEIMAAYTTYVNEYNEF